MTLGSLKSQQDVQKPKRKVSIFAYIFLSIFSLLSIFPLYWLFVVASNSNEEISKIPPSVIPGPNFLKQLKAVYAAVPFSNALINTILVSLVVAIFQVIFCSLAGFAYAKMQFPGKRASLLVIIGTMMLPAQLGIVVLYIMMANYFHWIDDFKSLVIPSMVTAFGVFWMRQIIDTQIPNEVLEAAKIDGAKNMRIYRNIVMPIIAPSVTVLGLFAFLGTWNDFLWPSLILNSPKRFTVQVAVNQLNGTYTTDYALKMCGAFLATLPLLILFVFVGKKLVSGIMDGAVKG
jgi:cellobiose transport system permease protein